ncbi:ABC transporter permease [Myroides marinus]|uniref:ABC-2 type transport system permease protein n=1 Tax=Myroides marinus TaxID=703342 RepID=A0A1H6VR00_9FLAO|nr:ABC transporter permease [Myroides marinus]MDM1367868.1 ABC transporter permease [Myroides marinus]MDM1375250.1 ABC transporter permease [Myroides marinus]MDM1377530.1 ABC transporter permease [Myroides marinus]MDM1382442.1 ABC transporter permease [Myroides marinus]MDM1384790.1 ABC transporter permease [Myroides marinus]
MSVLSLIIKREFIAKVRNKSFIVMTFVSPILFVVLTAFIAYLSSMKGDVKKIAIHDESGLFVKQFESNEAFDYQDLSAVDLNILKEGVKEEKYEGILFIPKSEDVNDYQKNVTYISNDSPSLSFVSKVELLLEDKITHINLEKSGIDLAVIDKAKANVNLSLVKADGEATVKGLNEIKIIIGGLFGYFIMMFIIIYGNMVMRSVIEEKTNRIIEIIISSVKPFQLMMGKIVGTSMAGLLQFIIWGVVGAVLLTIASSVLGINAMPGAGAAEAVQATGGMISNEVMIDVQNYVSEILSLPLISLFVYFIIFFIGGYFLYSSLYAAIGAAVDNETDTQQFLLPILLPLMLGVYIGFFTVMKDPHGTVATVFSMIPFTSPIVMLMRIPFGVPLWEVLLSITILFSTFILVVWIAAKIYRIGVLMYGKRPSWKELYKWLKY